MFAGTKDGVSYGFYLEADGLLDDYVELSSEEHMALMDGQATGKQIVFHPGEKPTLEDPPPPTEAEKAGMEIQELKSFLSETDYVAAKIAEGEATADEYADVLSKRRTARVRINELEAVIAAAEQSGSGQSESAAATEDGSTESAGSESAE